MGEYPEATYGALCQEYAPRDPFMEFGHRLITLNDLRIMVETLPGDSAMHRAHPDSRGWTTRDDIQAMIANSLRTLESMVAGIGGQEWPTSHVVSPAEGRKQEAERLKEIAEAHDWWRGIESQLPASEVPQ